MTPDQHPTPRTVTLRRKIAQEARHSLDFYRRDPGMAYANAGRCHALAMVLMDLVALAANELDEEHRHLRALTVEEFRNLLRGERETIR